MTTTWRGRQPISFTLERHALAARRFVARPTPEHRRNLSRTREAVRGALGRGELPTYDDHALARKAAAEERMRDRMYQLCHCGHCTARRGAMKAYTLGFRDGVVGRLGKRRLNEYLRPHKKHFRAGLADGRRAIEEALREYEEKLTTTL